jgi:membrane protein implicated in regulation of membrane protease activity
MMGGALGLAVLASLAAARSEALGAAGAAAPSALNGGYQAAFFVGAIFALVACAIGARFMRAGATAGAHAPDGGAHGRATEPAEG